MNIFYSYINTVNYTEMNVNKEVRLLQ